MEPIKFEESNVVYGENQKEYLPLPAFKQPNDPEGNVVTAWKLTPEEIEMVKETGIIWLSMLTFNQPLQPVILTTENPIIQNNHE